MREAVVVAGYEGGPWIARDTDHLFFLFESGGEIEIDDSLHGRFEAGEGVVNVHHLTRKCGIIVNVITDPGAWRQARDECFLQSGARTFHQSNCYRPR